MNNRPASMDIGSVKSDSKRLLSDVFSTCLLEVGIQCFCRLKHLTTDTIYFVSKTAVFLGSPLLEQSTTAPVSRYIHHT